jgi:hypothetical protein
MLVARELVRRKEYHCAGLVPEMRQEIHRKNMQDF